MPGPPRVRRLRGRPSRRRQYPFLSDGRDAAPGPVPLGRHLHSGGLRAPGRSGRAGGACSAPRGATAALRRTFGVSIGPVRQAAYGRALEPAWGTLGEEEGEAVFEEGRVMTLEEALVLKEPEADPGRPTKGILTAREAEVLSFVAEGLSDIEVAEK